METKFNIFVEEILKNLVLHSSKISNTIFIIISLLFTIYASQLEITIFIKILLLICTVIIGISPLYSNTLWTILQIISLFIIACFGIWNFILQRNFLEKRSKKRSLKALSFFEQATISCATGVFDQAIVQLEKATRYQPTLVEAQILLLNLYHMMEKTEKEEKLLAFLSRSKNLFVSSEAPQLMFREASHIYKIGDKNEAIRRLLEIQKEYPQFIHTYLLLGKIYMECNLLDDAISSIQQYEILTNDFKNQLYLHNKIEICKKQKDWENLAENLYKTARCWEDQHKYLLRVFHKNLMGMVLPQRVKFIADSELDEIKKYFVDKNNLKHFESLGKIFYAAGQLDKSFFYFIKALEILHNCHDFSDELNYIMNSLSSWQTPPWERKDDANDLLESHTPLWFIEYQDVLELGYPQIVAMEIGTQWNLKTYGYIVGFDKNKISILSRFDMHGLLESLLIEDIDRCGKKELVISTLNGSGLFLNFSVKKPMGKTLLSNFDETAELLISDLMENTKSRVYICKEEHHQGCHIKIISQSTYGNCNNMNTQEYWHTSKNKQFVLKDKYPTRPTLRAVTKFAELIEKKDFSTAYHYIANSLLLSYEPKSFRLTNYPQSCKITNYSQFCKMIKKFPDLKLLEKNFEFLSTDNILANEDDLPIPMLSCKTFIEIAISKKIKYNIIFTLVHENNNWKISVIKFK